MGGIISTSRCIDVGSTRDRQRGNCRTESGVHLLHAECARDACLVGNTSSKTRKRCDQPVRRQHPVISLMHDKSNNKLSETSRSNCY